MNYKLKFGAGFLIYVVFFYFVFYFSTFEKVKKDYRRDEMEIDFNNPEIGILVSTHGKSLLILENDARFILGQWVSENDRNKTLLFTKKSGLYYAGENKRAPNWFGLGHLRGGKVSIDPSLNLKHNKIVKINFDYDVIKEILIIKNTTIHKIENQTVFQIPEKDMLDLPIQLNGTYKTVIHPHSPLKDPTLGYPPKIH